MSHYQIDNCADVIIEIVKKEKPEVVKVKIIEQIESLLEWFNSKFAEGF